MQDAGSENREAQVAGGGAEWTVSLGDAFRQRLAREGHIALGDLTGDLLFPRLFRVPGLALRPERVVFGLGIVTVVAVCALIAGLVSGGPWPNAAVYQSIAMTAQTMSQDIGAGRFGLVGFGVGIVLRELGYLVVEQPLGTGIVLLGLVGAWGVFGGAVCRGVALESSAGLHLSGRAALRFGLTRGWSAAGAVALAPALVFVGLLLVGLAGAATMAFPGVDILGAALFGVAIVAGLAAAVLIVVFALALPMIAAAVAAEDDDAFDALQRALGYAVARPLTLLGYLLLALVQGVVATGLVWWLGSLAVWLAASAISLVSAIVGGGAWRVIGEGMDPFVTDPSFAGRIVAGWAALPIAVALGFAVSYVHAAGTVVYLNLRRLVDGQDVEEVRVEG